MQLFPCRRLVNNAIKNGISFHTRVIAKRLQPAVSGLCKKMDSDRHKTLLQPHEIKSLLMNV